MILVLCFNLNVHQMVAHSNRQIGFSMWNGELLSLYITHPNHTFGSFIPRFIRDRFDLEKPRPTTIGEYIFSSSSRISKSNVVMVLVLLHNLNFIVLQISMRVFSNHHLKRRLIGDYNRNGIHILLVIQSIEYCGQ